MTSDLHVDVEGRAVRITSPDRVMWPRAGVTKLEMVRYYTQTAPFLLPHLEHRPVTLHRFPEGVEGPHFYQTRCPPRPAWVDTQRMYTFRSGKVVDAPVINDLASLLWAVNLATIEFHPYLGTSDDLEQPTVVVFDLDPGPPAGLLEACSVALDVRSVLTSQELSSVVKTSGGSGIHVYVPLNSGQRYGETKRFARAVAEVLARRRDDVVTRMTRSERPGKVFVDWSQNDPGKSTVAPYSLRGTSIPLVSAPVGWGEIEAAVDTGDVAQLLFTPTRVLERAQRDGDAFRAAIETVQTLDRVGVG